MELDAVGGASFEQLQELIRKECDKRKKNRPLEQKYNKLQESVDLSQQHQNMPMRGPRGASNKKKSQPSNQRRTANHRGRSTSRRRPRPPTGRNGKAEGTNNDVTNDNLEKQKIEQALTIATEEKAYQLISEQVTTTIENNLKQQFGFVADP